tara:strand:- start:301 stop:741 length:441 start_codon:yes stop_codon:yes gene_type:complete
MLDGDTIVKVNSLNIQLTHESKIQKLDFITWKDDLRSFYTKPFNGKPRVVTLTPALPDKPSWTGGPFPEYVPKEIAPCILLPPRILEPHEVEGASSKTKATCLYLKPEDDAPLAARLNDIQKKAKRLVEEKKKTINKTEDPSDKAR